MMMSNDDKPEIAYHTPRLRRRTRAEKHRHIYNVSALSEREEAIVTQQARLQKERNALNKALDAAELQQKAREHAEKGLQALADILVNPESPPSAKISAAELIFNRAYGRPTQTNVNSNVNLDAKPSEVTGKQLEQRIARALQRVEDLTAGAAQPAVSEERPTDVRKIN